MTRTLADWLAHCERPPPAAMDLSLERTLEVKRRLGIVFQSPLIVVAGTNGKGSTCAMLEAIAHRAGYRVGLYQKPELVHFEERCRIDAAPVAADALAPHFEAVEAARGDITLTKFEFSTLAIARCLALAPLDLVILEVGLGGRFDAVNAFDADCAVITSIDLDHLEYLGPDRESIGREKAGVMRAGRPVICSDPQPPASIAECAAQTGADLRQLGRDFGFSGDRQQWSWHGRERRHRGLAYPALRGANQLLNAAGVLAAFEALHERLPIGAQAVREGLATVELPGRFQVLPGRPTIVLDVAHNPHAVAALAHNLDQMGFHPRTHAVFGVMRDKDIGAMLATMASRVDTWHLTDLDNARAASASEVARILEGVAPTVASCHPDPAAAMRAALGTSDGADRIVVFGSFLTVGGVLRDGLPPRTAPHAA